MAVKTGEAARLASHPPVLILLNKKQGVAEPLPVFKSFVKDSQRWELAAEAATTAAAAQKQDNPDKVTSVSASASTSLSLIHISKGY